MTRQNFIAIAASVAAVLTGCVKEGDVPGVTDTEIRFGSHTDLSGPIAIYGLESKQGIDMRFAEANEAGGVHGRQLKFIVEDSGYTVPASIRAADKLINHDRIFAMLLAMGTPNNLAVMPTQLEAGVPNLFPLTGSIQMREPFRKLVFTQRGIYYDEMRAAVRYFTENFDRKVPCVSYIDNDYGREILHGASDQAMEMGIELGTTTSHKRTETEFTAAVLKLRDAGCDLVLFGTVVIDTIQILSTAQRMGWEDVIFVGNNAASGSAVASHPSGAAEGYYAFIHMTRIYGDTEEDPVVLAWFNKFKELFGAEPDAAAMEGYRGADLVIKALEIAGPDVTRENFIAALESIDDYTDIFGYPLSFSPTEHNGVHESVLVQVQNGRWVELDVRINY